MSTWGASRTCNHALGANINELLDQPIRLGSGPTVYLRDIGTAGAMQFPDFGSVCGRGCRPPQPFSVLSRMSQARAGPFLQHLPLEGGKHRQHGSHCASGRSGQVQCLSQRNETHSEMV